MYKLLESNYDAESGISFVKIATECGYFYGYAYLNPEEDKDIASNFFGCELAEYRALIDYFSKKKMFLNQRLLALLNLRNDYFHNNINWDSSIEILNKRISQMEKQKKEYNDNIKNLKRLIHNKPIERLATLNKIQNKKEKQEN